MTCARGWMAGRYPTWIGDLLQRPNVPQQIDETAHGEEPVALSTYHSPSFCLGVASCELKTQEVIFIALQSSVFHAQYQRPDGDRCGVLFSRYILDDQWLSFQTTPSRAPGQVVPEEGHFYGVHERGRAIGLYAPRGLDAWTRRTSAKAVLVWTEIEQVDEIWIGQHKVDSLPAAVPRRRCGGRRQRCPVDGRPAARTDRSGRRCPHPLGRTGRSSGLGDVQLYGTGQDVLGNGQTRLLLPRPAPLRFLRRTGRAHFDYASGANFAAEVASGALVDEAAPPATYTAGGERPLRVEYARDDRILGIEVDLYEWSLKRRWTQDGSLDWPMHESPYARQSASGQVSIGGATLTCDKGPVWLCACPGGKRYVAAYSGIEMTSLRLEVPGDVVELAEMGAGTVIWDEGQVKIEAILP